MVLESGCRPFLPLPASDMVERAAGSARSRTSPGRARRPSGRARLHGVIDHFFAPVPSFCSTLRV